MQDEYECGYCGGEAVLSADGITWVHADAGDRAPVSPGDFVSRLHNMAGTAIMSYDLVKVTQS